MIDRLMEDAGTARRSLFDDLGNGSALAVNWLWPAYDTPDREGSGDQYGFHPSFTALVAALAGNPREEPGKSFVAELLRVLPLHARTDRLARQWMVEVLKAGVLPHLVGAPAEVVTALIGLHRAHLDGNGAPKAWRPLRSTLARMTELDIDTAEYVEVATAAAWDIEQTPGASGDTASTLGSLLLQQALRSQGWTAELSRELGELETDIRERALGSIDKEADRETMIRAFTEERDRLLAHAPRAAALAEQRDACFANANAVRNDGMASLREQLVSAAARDQSEG